MTKRTVEDLRPLSQTRGLQCHPAHCLPACLEAGGNGVPRLQTGIGVGKALTIFLYLPSGFVLARPPYFYWCPNLGCRVVYLCICQTAASKFPTS